MAIVDRTSTQSKRWPKSNTDYHLLNSSKQVQKDWKDINVCSWNNLLQFSPAGNTRILAWNVLGVGHLHCTQGTDEHHYHSIVQHVFGLLICSCSLSVILAFYVNNHKSTQMASILEHSQTLDFHLHIIDQICWRQIAYILINYPWISYIIFNWYRPTQLPQIEEITTNETEHYITDYAVYIEGRLTLSFFCD